MDDPRLAASPVLLGRGDAPFLGLDLPELGYLRTEHVAPDRATYVVFERRG
ncbi:MAG: hypothetical protein H6837_07710 [Planctomycetes bacterium]|nr:hypothetical protein [Planctomycetota bacterium]